MQINRLSMACHLISQQCYLFVLLQMMFPYSAGASSVEGSSVARIPMTSPVPVGALAEAPPGIHSSSPPGGPYTADSAAGSEPASAGFWPPTPPYGPQTGSANGCNGSSASCWTTSPPPVSAAGMLAYKYVIDLVMYQPLDTVSTEAQFSSSHVLHVVILCPCRASGGSAA